MRVALNFYVDCCAAEVVDDWQVGIDRFGRKVAQVVVGVLRGEDRQDTSSNEIRHTNVEIRNKQSGKKL